MIFSKLFNNKAKWQHKNSNVRIESITNDLAIDAAKDREILITLLNNDDNELVRRAALLKLHSFALYLQASQENSHAKLKEFAYQQIIKMLLEGYMVIM